MLDILTASDSDPWIVSVEIPGGNADYEHRSKIIDQLDAVNVGWA